MNWLSAAFLLWITPAVLLFVLLVRVMRRGKSHDIPATSESDTAVAHTESRGL